MSAPRTAKPPGSSTIGTRRYPASDSERTRASRSISDSTTILLSRRASSRRGTTLRASALAGTSSTRHGRSCARWYSVAMRLMAARRSGLTSAYGDDSLAAKTSTSPSPVSSASSSAAPRTKNPTSSAARRAASRSAATKTTRWPWRARAAARAAPALPRTPAMSIRSVGVERTRATTSRTRDATMPSGGRRDGSGSSSIDGAGGASSSAVRPVCSPSEEVSDGELGIEAPGT